MSADELWSLLYDEYLPFRLYAEHRQGASLRDISQQTGLPEDWVEERIAAAEVGIRTGGKLLSPAFDRRSRRRPDAA